MQPSTTRLPFSLRHGYGVAHLSIAIANTAMLFFLLKFLIDEAGLATRPPSPRPCWPRPAPSTSPAWSCAPPAGTASARTSAWPTASSSRPSATCPRTPP